MLLFSPLPDEPPVNELLYQAIGEGKTACLPRYRSETNSYEAAIVENPASDLREARYGIPEPVEACPAFPLNQLDLVFVPGVAFAPDGARLGRGRGFYDRLLKMVNSQKIGIGFSAQLLPVIPTEPHDARLTAIVTPAGGWLATTDGLA